MLFVMLYIALYCAVICLNINLLKGLQIKTSYNLTLSQKGKGPKNYTYKMSENQVEGVKLLLEAEMIWHFLGKVGGG